MTTEQVDRLKLMQTFAASATDNQYIRYSFSPADNVALAAALAEHERPKERGCEACGSCGAVELTHVRTTNGGLKLCRQCLDELNDPRLAEAERVIRELVKHGRRVEHSEPALSAAEAWLAQRKGG